MAAFDSILSPSDLDRAASVPADSHKLCGARDNARELTVAELKFISLFIDIDQSFGADASAVLTALTEKEKAVLNTFPCYDLRLRSYLHAKDMFASLLTLSTGIAAFFKHTNMLLPGLFATDAGEENSNRLHPHQV